MKYRPLYAAGSQAEREVLDRDATEEDRIAWYLTRVDREYDSVFAALAAADTRNLDLIANRLAMPDPRRTQ